MKKIILAIAIAAVAVLAGWSLLKVFQEVPLWGSSAKSVLDRPFKIGIVHQRQQNEIVTGFRKGMEELGYSNVLYEDIEVVVGPTLKQDTEQVVRKFVQDGVSLIVAPLEVQARVAINVTKEMGSNIPVIFGAMWHDPVNYGLVQSFRSSGNNATGVAVYLVGLVQKQLEFINTIVPGATKIGIFTQGFMNVPPHGDELLAEIKKQAPGAGFTVVEYTTTAVSPAEKKKAWWDIAKTIKPGGIDALYHIPGHPYNFQEVAEDHLAISLGILMFAPLQDLPNGGQIGYGANLISFGKQTAGLADKIFKGAKPADIPIEHQEKNDIIIHPARLDTAGIKLPESILNIVSRKIGE